MDSHDAAWLAGLFQTRGGITQNKNRHGNLKWEVCFSSEDKQLVHRVADLIGAGTVHTRGAGWGSNDYHYARVKGKKADRVLESIRPYIVA